MNKQNDIQLSEHFKLSEFTKSITAERLGIDNKPGYEHILAMRRLCREVLEPLRQHYGQPIRIMVPVDRPQHELRPDALRAQQSHAQPLAAHLVPVGP